MGKYRLRISLLVGTLGIVISSPSIAQLELNIYAGGNLSDRFQVAGGFAKIFGSAVYGGSVWYEMPRVAFEVEYMHQRADGEINSTLLFDQDVRVGMNYLLAGTHWLFELENTDAFDFNLGLKGGVTGILPESDRYNDIWRFTIAGNAGVKYNVSERFGVRLQIHILIPVQFGAGTFWVGNGGSGVGVTQFTTITQLGGVLGAYYRITI